MKGFKYQRTLKVLLNKHKINEDIEYATVFVSILQLKQQLILINMILINPFKKFYTEYAIGLMKDLVG